MSGICGIVNLNRAPVKREALEAMAEAAAYRGPDGIRKWIANHVGFCHLALNVTPESLRERQPASTPDGKLTLTADARIDNRSELMDIFARQDWFHLEEPTDADLILAAYRVWGLECPAHLIGDFAFAIWDAEHERLFAARDPLAMRPLYYRIEHDRFLFGSEVKQILAAPDVPIRMSEVMVGIFLSGAIGPENLTYYEGIFELPPANALVVDRAGHRTWRYWDIDPELRIEYRNEDDYYEHFRELFAEAVRCRLRSAHPVGIFLSGGIDSGSVASMAGMLLKQSPAGNYPDFQTYSYAFTDLPECDERHISNHITEAYDLPSTSIVTGDAWPLKDYPAHSPDRDEPLMGPYQVMINTTLEAARAHGVRTMLSGGYGDHMVGASTLYYRDLLQNFEWFTLWQDLRAQASAENVSIRALWNRHLAKFVPSMLWPADRAPWLRHRARGFRSAPQRSEPDFPPWLAADFIQRTGLKDFSGKKSLPDSITGHARRHRYSWFNAFEHRLRTWTNRNYASYGISYREPWGDRRILSFVFAIPQRILGRSGRYKPLAYEAMRGIIPEQARQNAGKIIPAPLYYRTITGNARNTVLSLLTDSKAAQLGFLDGQKLRAHYESIVNHGEEHNGFWPTLALEMWLRQHWSQPYT